LSVKLYKGRPLVPGEAEGEAIVADSISFYGDVDVERGVLVDGRVIAGRVIVARRSRGSTVGPYILYALKRRALAPKAIVLTTRSDPVLVAGAVLAEVILIDSVPEDILQVVRDGVLVKVERNGLIHVSEYRSTSSL